MSKKYDLVILGGGAAGCSAAIQGAKLGHRVALVEKEERLGGAAINTGTIPSKAVREAVVYLTGASKRGFFGRSHRVKKDITLDDLRAVSVPVRENLQFSLVDGMERNRVDVIHGAARFTAPNAVRVETPGAGVVEVEGDRFVIAVGTRAAEPEGIDFDGRTIVTSDTLAGVARIPESIIVVGGGVIGTEFATVFRTLGLEVTLIEGRDRLLGFLDREILESFQHAVRRMGITLRLGEKVTSIEKVTRSDGREEVHAALESGKTDVAETLLYAIGRQGVCLDLGLENVGLEPDARGRLTVDDTFRTSVEHVYAVGDIIGHPALAATSREQGRVAVCNAFGATATFERHLLPYGIYSVPEISMVGQTEEELTKAGVAYVAGIAQYQELARAQIIGDQFGMLKILFNPDDRELLGVHCIGTSATEIVHIGQMVMALGGTLDSLTTNVFNYPTLAEAYKVAALNGINKLS